MCLCVSVTTMRKYAMNFKESKGNIAEDLEEAKERGKM